MMQGWSMSVFPGISEDGLSFVALVVLVYFPVWSLLRMFRTYRRNARSGTMPRTEPVEFQDGTARVPVTSYLVPREWDTLLWILFVLCCGSIFVRGELGFPPTPAVTPSPCRAPWFFSGIQELASHLPVTLAGRLIPLALIAGLMAVPFVTTPTTVGRYTYRGRGVSVPVFLTLWCGWFLLIGVGIFKVTHGG